MISRWLRAAVPLLVLGAVPCLLSGCASLDLVPATVTIAPAIGDGRVELPGSFEKDLFVALVDINGEGPFRMVLDTGADGVVLTPLAAERLAGARSDGFTVVQGHSREASVVGGKVEIAELRAGGFVANGLDAVVIGLGRAQSYFHEPIDGVLGWPLFSDATLIVDYPARAVSVARSGAAHPSHAAVFPIVKRRMEISVPIAGVTRRVTVDTGATGAIALRPGDLPKGSYTHAGEGSIHGINATTTSQIVRLRDRFEFAGQGFGELPISLGSDSRLIGAALMRPFVVTFDQPEGVIVFQGPG